MTDESLMTSYRKGSEEAFEGLYEKYSPMVYGFIFKRLRESEAKAFNLKVWRLLHENRDHYQGHEFLPWFFSLFSEQLMERVNNLGRITERPESPNEPVSYEAFLKSGEVPSEDISLAVKKDILFTFRKKQIYAKFFLFFFAGALAPLSFNLKSWTLLACALFGWAAVFIAMKWEEIRWVLRRVR